MGRKRYQLGRAGVSCRRDRPICRDRAPQGRPAGISAHDDERARIPQPWTESDGACLARWQRQNPSPVRGLRCHRAELHNPI